MISPFIVKRLRLIVAGHVQLLSAIAGRPGVVLRKLVTMTVLTVFVFTNITNTCFVGYARAEGVLLPAPLQYVPLSPHASSPVLAGLRFNEEKPAQIEFLIDTKDKKDISRKEAAEQIKYFLTALTIPEKDIWVNLSPREANRVIADNLGRTNMGEALLAEDYLLKQVASSLTYPEKPTGKMFWDEIYKTMHSTQVSLETLNRVWIVPNESEIYEDNNKVMISKASLKVFLEDEYLSSQEQAAPDTNPGQDQARGLIRKMILPLINAEVNHGENFSSLRQIYHAIILAVWFKEKLRNSFFKQYVDRSKLSGMSPQDNVFKEKIYAQYLEAFKKGVYNYIKEEYDPQSEAVVARKFFAGGFSVLGKEGNFRLKRTAHDPSEGMAMAVKMVVNFSRIPRAPESRDASMVSDKGRMVPEAGYQFSRWLRSLFKAQLLQDPYYARHKGAVDFLLKKGGLAFAGRMDQIPQQYRDVLRPVEDEHGFVICEGPLKILADSLKDRFPRYDQMSPKEIQDSLKVSFVHYLTLMSKLNKVDDRQFKDLKQELLEVVFHGDTGIFQGFLQGIKRQYGYTTASHRKILQSFIGQLINEAVLFDRLPQLMGDTADGFQLMDVNTEVLDIMVSFIRSARIFTDEIALSAAADKLDGLIASQRMKYALSDKVDELFEQLPVEVTSTEQQYDVYRRIRKAWDKLQALDNQHRWAFQQKGEFDRRNKEPLSKDSFDVLVKFHEMAKGAHPNLLGAVLSFMDIAKASKFKDDARYKDLNFANHPEASAFILKDKKIFEAMGFSAPEIELALTLVGQHGLIGQAKRGEVADEVFVPMLQLAIDRRDIDILKMYFLLNVIDTSLVYEGIFTEDFFRWFYKKYQDLEEIVLQAIEEEADAVTVLEARRLRSLASHEQAHQYALQRLLAMRPKSSMLEMEQAVAELFRDNPGAREDLFELLARQRNSFSLWYPEVAMSWLDIQQQIKFVYLSLRAAEYKAKKNNQAIDINYFDVAREVDRQDEQRLRDESRAFLAGIMQKIQLEDIFQDQFIAGLFTQGAAGLSFAYDEKNNALYASLDTLNILGTSQKDARARINEIEQLLQGPAAAESLFFIKDSSVHQLTRSVGIFTFDFDPFQERHRNIIEQATKDYNLDEVILVLPRTAGSDGLKTPLAQRLFMLEKEWEGVEGISIAVAPTEHLLEVNAAVTQSRKDADYLFHICDSNVFEQMLDEERSGYSPSDLNKFFKGQNRLLVAPYGNFKDVQIEQRLMESDHLDYLRFIYPLKIGRKYLFDATTEARRRLRDNVPENNMLSLKMTRLIKALDLYQLPSRDDVKAFSAEPRRMTFVNLTSERHHVISEPQGISVLTGDLRRVYGSGVSVNVINTQLTGVTASEIIEELKRTKTQIIGLSAQLESTRKLFAVLDALKDDPWFKAERPMVLVGNNIPTNDSKGILNKYPFVVTVRGEGELAMRAIIRYARGEVALEDIPAASFVKDGRIIENDGIPVSIYELGVPARDTLLEILKHNGDVWIETSRGCGWGKCAFCFKDPFRAHKWEPYPDHVVLEAFEYLLKLGVPQVSLSDPEFFAGGAQTMDGMRRARRLAEGLIKLNKKYGRKINIAVSMRADSVYHEPQGGRQEKIKEENKYKVETLKMLKEAGFFSAFLGTEAGSDRLLMLYKKGVTKKENAEAIHILRELNYKVCCGYIPIAPDATLEDLIENAEFVEENDAYIEVSFPLNQLKVQSGTEYYTRMMKAGLLGSRKSNLHQFDVRYKDINVQRVADMINIYGREIGSVFYVLKYMYRTKDLNNVSGEEAEREVLRQFFYRYNKMEVSFLKDLALNIKDPFRLQQVIVESRQSRLSLVLEIEQAIASGAIKDEDGILIKEIAAIRPLLNKFISGKLPGIPVMDQLAFAAMDDHPMTTLVDLIQRGDIQGSVQSMKVASVLAEKIKGINEYVQIDVPLIEPTRKLELYIRMSDDLKSVSFYKVNSLGAEYVPPEKIREEYLEPILVDVPTSNIVFPENYIYKSDQYAAEEISRLVTLMGRGGFYTEYRGVVTDQDTHIDRDVWRFNADTGNMIDKVGRTGYWNRKDIKVFYELGVGGGHGLKTAMMKLPNIESVRGSDISFWALVATQRNIHKYAAEKGIDVQAFIGKGIKKYFEKYRKYADSIWVNPPYIPVPPWMRNRMDPKDDPYAGTGVMKEMIADAINCLNPDNPNADIIMGYSSLAEEDMQEYIRAYGQLVDIETIDEGHLLPLKIEKIDRRWMEWMRGRGLIIKDDAKPYEFKYWHALKVVRIKPRQVVLKYKSGGTVSVRLSADLLSRKKFMDLELNNLVSRDKLRLLSLLKFDFKSWMDEEWHELNALVDYFTLQRLPILKERIEGQLQRRVHLSAANLLEPLYDPDAFMDGNIIRKIYFNGKEPNIDHKVIACYRDGINKMPTGVKATLLTLFKGYLEDLGWKQGIAQALRGWGYSGDFEITDIRDTSVGAGVYEFTLRLPPQDAKTPLRIFIKKDRRWSGLINEAPLLEGQKEFAGVSRALLKDLPFYYINPDAGKPNLLVAPHIEEQSLDVLLTEIDRVKKGQSELLDDVALQQEVGFVEGVSADIEQEARSAVKKIQSASAIMRSQGIAEFRACVGYIKRGLALDGKVDLHLHTIKSDGFDTPAAVVLKGWLNGVRTLALVDHMTLDGIFEAMEMAEALGGIQVIPGVEFYAYDPQAEPRQLHITGYFPRIKTTEEFRDFLKDFQEDQDGLYESMGQVFKARNLNVGLVVAKFNEMFKRDGLEITPEEIVSCPSELQILYYFAEVVKNKYKKKFAGDSVEDIKKKYFWPALKQTISQGKTYMPLEDVLRLVARHNGLSLVAHFSTTFAKLPTLGSLAALLKKYRVIRVDGKERLGLAGVGLKQSGERSAELAVMLKDLSSQDARFAKIPLLGTQESDYDGKFTEDIVLGQRNAEGKYEYFGSSSMVMDMVRLSQFMKDIDSLPENSQDYPEFVPTASLLLEDIALGSIELMAWGDFWGRNDRRLSNFRAARDEQGRLKGLVGFDIANALDKDSRGENPWHMNFDWNIEDIKQGLHELVMLTLLDQYQVSRSARGMADRLAGRIVLFNRVKEKYRQIWESMSIQRDVVRAIIKKQYGEGSDIARTKLEVLDAWLAWNDTHPDAYLKDSFRALLEDYETRKIYYKVMDQIKNKSGMAVLGDLFKYYVESGQELRMSSKVELFRGVLSKLFMDRRDVKRPLSIEDVFAQIDTLAVQHLGLKILDDIHQEVRDVKREADYVIEQVFDKKDVPLSDAVDQAMINSLEPEYGGIDLHGLEIHGKPSASPVDINSFDDDFCGMTFEITEISHARM